MALVLAIEPHSNRKGAVRRLTTAFAGHEVLVASSMAEGWARVGSRVPDLVLVDGDHEWFYCFVRQMQRQRADPFAALAMWAQQEEPPSVSVPDPEPVAPPPPPPPPPVSVPAPIAPTHYTAPSTMPPPVAALATIPLAPRADAPPRRTMAARVTSRVANEWERRVTNEWERRVAVRTPPSWLTRPRLIWAGAAAAVIVAVTLLVGRSSTSAADPARDTMASESAAPLAKTARKPPVKARAAAAPRGRTPATPTIDDLNVGWLALFSPFELQVTENGRSIPFGDDSRAMLRVGHHELQLTNSTLGYHEMRSIDVKAAEVTAVSIQPPMSTVTVTASPGAEVWIDGARAGETPLIDVPVPIGTREIVLRNPAYADRRLTVTVTMSKVRIDVDLTKPAL